jgi:hypothetical protein
MKLSPLEEGFELDWERSIRSEGNEKEEVKFKTF